MKDDGDIEAASKSAAGDSSDDVTSPFLINTDVITTSASATDIISNDQHQQKKKQQQQLLLPLNNNTTHPDPDPDQDQDQDHPLAQLAQLSRCQEILTVFLFCFMNFLNYINRYSTPPIVGRLERAFHVDDTSLGMVQSGFEICYVFTSPAFGFLGDRFQRKYIMAFSLLLSTASGLASSFIPESSFLALLVTRSLLGVAEASYTNICPSIIGDLFVGKKRTLVLTVYQFAIPLGCGVGYILAGAIADYLDDWRWAFRLTPLPMLLSAICLLVFIHEPERGQAEKAVGRHQTTTYREDLDYLVRIPSFVMASLAFVGVSFATGSLCYWTPDLILRMLAMQGHLQKHSEAEVGLIFGVITIGSGLFGVAVGVFISNTLLKRICGLSADGIVCGIGMLLGAPVVYAALFYLETSITASWCLIALGIAFLSCNLVLLSEITLNVVIATRRATAESFQTTICHLLGDAASPYLSGFLSDHLRMSHNRGAGHAVTTHVAVADYTSLQSSLFMNTLIMVASGGLFMLGSLYINEDSDKAKNTITATSSASSKTKK